MKLKDLDSSISFFNKNRLDNKKLFKEYIGLRFENNKEFKPIINQIRMQNYENANQMLEKSVKYGVHKMDAFRFRGEFYFTYQEYLGAWEQYDQILKNDSRDIEALFISSVCAYALGDIDEYDDRLKHLKFYSPHITDKLIFYIQLISKYNTVNLFDDDPTSISKVDLIILFGKKLPSNGELSESYLSRLERTLEFSQRYPNSDIIALGGAVHNKHYEAIASYEWLIENGVSAKRVILDMVGLDVVAQTLSVIDLLQQEGYTDLLIISDSDMLPRQYLTLTAALHERHLSNVKLHGLNHEDVNHKTISRIECLKCWHSALRAAGVFTKQFYK